MLNAAQFSSAKSVATNKLLKEALFNDKEDIKGYSEYAKDAKAITDIVNETWMRTEYDTATRQAVAGAEFISMRADADLYPYWIYVETTSDNPREDHLALVGTVFRIGDPEGDECFPPNGFNCSCGSEFVDGQYLEENNLKAVSNEQAKELLDKEIDPQFRFNPADQGILPKESHSYFQALPSANDASYKDFSDEQ